jgi:hypothetical protein
MIFIPFILATGELEESNKLQGDLSIGHDSSPNKLRRFNNQTKKYFVALKGALKIFGRLNSTNQK